MSHRDDWVSIAEEEYRTWLLAGQAVIYERVARLGLNCAIALNSPLRLAAMAGHTVPAISITRASATP